MSSLSFDRINTLATLQLSIEDTAVLLQCSEDDIVTFLAEKKLTYDALVKDVGAKIAYLGRNKLIKDFLSKNGDVTDVEYRKVMKSVDEAQKNIEKKKKEALPSSVMVIINNNTAIDIRFVRFLSIGRVYNEFWQRYDYSVIINDSKKIEEYSNIWIACDSEEDAKELLEELTILREDYKTQ